MRHVDSYTRGERILAIACAILLAGFGLGLGYIMYDSVSSVPPKLNEHEKFVKVNDTYTSPSIKYMDDYEKHYDANGPFVLIDTNSNLLGVYDGNKALNHFDIYVGTKENHIVTTVENLRDYHIVLPANVRNYLIDQGFQPDTPVVVDRYPIS